ncbi:MAG: Crp/Fnr family transcriptional regulator [Burkholderiales bacterium]|nr:MAG: Crp/Fnr family transcriptional regulator [Burkholderiales bacterium]
MPLLWRRVCQNSDNPLPPDPLSTSDEPPHGPVADLRLALQTDDWFAGCAPGLQQVLLGTGRLRRLAAGQALFARGGEADGLCCLTSGALRIGALDAEGQAAVLAYLEPYQWFGEISMIDGQPRTHDAVADVDSQVLVVPRTALMAFLDTHPVHWRDLARLACRKLRVSFAVLEELAQLPLEDRVLRRLHLLAQGYGSRDVPRRRVRVAQEVLARMLGISRQSTNRALRQLEARGLLRLHYGEIELLE